MKTSIILSIYYLFFLDLSCSDFKVGTFDLPSDDGSTHRIIRTEIKQTEFVGKNGLETEFDIKWLNECTYIIFNRRVLKGIDENPEFNRDTLVCEIKNIKGNVFTVTASFKRFDLKLDAEMKKIK